MSDILWPVLDTPEGAPDEGCPAIMFEDFEPPECNSRYLHFLSLLSPEERERKSKPKEQVVRVYPAVPEQRDQPQNHKEDNEADQSLANDVRDLGPNTQVIDNPKEHRQKDADHDQVYENCNHAPIPTVILAASITI